MARTTSDAVQAVLLPGGDYDTVNSPSLEPFIRIASLIVDRVETCATEKGKTLTEDELTEMESWLAAHFYTRSDQPYASKTTERASATFQGKTGMYLEASHYGQTALALDYSGCLAALAAGTQRKTAAGYWLGRPPSEQTPYYQRD